MLKNTAWVLTDFREEKVVREVGHTIAEAIEAGDENFAIQINAAARPAHIVKS